MATQLWRTGALKEARDIRGWVGVLVSSLTMPATIFVNNSDTAEREKYGMTPQEYLRPRQWEEYVEHRPERLRYLADHCNGVASRLMQLAKSLEKQAIDAEHLIKLREAGKIPDPKPRAKRNHSRRRRCSLDGTPLDFVVEETIYSCGKCGREYPV